VARIPLGPRRPSEAPAARLSSRCACLAADGRLPFVGGLPQQSDRRRESGRVIERGLPFQMDCGRCILVRLPLALGCGCGPSPLPPHMCVDRRRRVDIREIQPSLHPHDESREGITSIRSPAPSPRRRRQTRPAPLHRGRIPRRAARPPSPPLPSPFPPPGPSPTPRVLLLCPWVSVPGSPPPAAPPGPRCHRDPKGRSTRGPSTTQNSWSTSCQRENMLDFWGFRAFGNGFKVAIKTAHRRFQNSVSRKTRPVKECLVCGCVCVCVCVLTKCLPPRVFHPPH